MSLLAFEPEGELWTGRDDGAAVAKQVGGHGVIKRDQLWQHLGA